MFAKSAVAIDGPGGSGKTTVGRMLAERLGYLFIDTGKMYRAVTWEAIQRGIDPNDAEAVTKLAEDLSIEFSQSGPERVTVNDRDVTEEIKRPEVDRQVSLVSKHGGVRTALVERQRRLAERGKALLAGRDIGTVVLPDAGLKVYLLASSEERARRRHLELRNLGHEEDYDSILSSLKARDKIDSERELAPLKPAEDALMIDTDHKSPEQVVEEIIQALDNST
jgi:cytidylate kinase